MAIMNNDDPRYKRVIIQGPFGSGKSILLQHKAIQLNEKPEYNGKILFVDMGPVASMRFHRVKIELDDNRGIVVEELDWFRVSFFFINQP